MSAQTPAPDTETSHTSKLEEEGDVAADYLEELLDIADLDGDIDIDIGRYNNGPEELGEAVHSGYNLQCQRTRRQEKGETSR